MKRAVLISLLLWCSAARADWEYTNWGEPPEKVLSKSGGALRLTTPDEKLKNFVGGETPMLVGTYQTGPYAFEALLFFGDDGRSLDKVLLGLKDYGVRSHFQQGFIRMQGKPSESNDNGSGVIIKWRNEKDNNFISLFDVKPIQKYKIMYQPLSAATN